MANQNDRRQLSFRRRMSNRFGCVWYSAEMAIGVDSGFLATAQFRDSIWQPKPKAASGV